MLYTISEFLTLLKEDMGIKDIPLPIDDAQLLKRFEKSALLEFSQRYPRLVSVRMGPQQIIDESNRYFNGSVKYRIPYEYYQDATILAVVGIDAGAYGGGSDNTYMPTISLGAADTILESIADIKMAASLGSIMTHAPTTQFFPPDKVAIYSGWYGGIYRLELALTHDINLTTIPPTAMTHLRQLAVLDLEEYLYNQLKRKDQLDVGVGTINLKIDEWANARDEKKQLLETWDNEGANLDIDPINYF